MLDKEIAQIIERDLPNQVGTILKQKLEKANQDAVELATTKRDFSNLVTQNKQLHEKLASYDSLESLIETEQNLYRENEKRARFFENELLRKELHLCEKSKQDLFRLVEKVFGHPSVSVREVSSHSKNDGSYHQIENTSSDKTTTTTTIKE